MTSHAQARCSFTPTRREERSILCCSLIAKRWFSCVSVDALPHHPVDVHPCVAAVGRRMRLAVAWGRWWCALEVAAGQRCAELRAAVLLRAAWAVLRRYAERRAAKRELQAVSKGRGREAALE